MNKDAAYPSSFVGRRALGAQFTKFVLSGGAGTATQYLVLIVLVKLFELPAGRASMAGAIAGAVVVYLLNRRFTFTTQRGHRETLPRFALMAIVGALMNGALVGYLSNTVGLYFLLAQIMATVVVLVFNFIVSKLWIFR